MATGLKNGDMLPQMQLKSTSGVNVTNTKLIGKNILLFIYPKDDSSSCVKEAKGFSDFKDSFLKKDVEIYGLSKDSIESHIKFINKHNLKIELLSDESTSFIQAIGAWVEKSMYGKKFMGVERTTILVSTDGRVSNLWRKVKVPGHVEQVLDFLENVSGD